MTTDLKALNYMLFNYPKPSIFNFANRQLFGNGASLVCKSWHITIKAHMIKKDLHLLKEMFINVRYGSPLN